LPQLSSDQFWGIAHDDARVAKYRYSTDDEVVLPHLIGEPLTDFRVIGAVHFDAEDPTIG